MLFRSRYPRVRGRSGRVPRALKVWLAASLWIGVHAATAAAQEPWTHKINVTGGSYYTDTFSYNIWTTPSGSTTSRPNQASHFVDLAHYTGANSNGAFIMSATSGTTTLGGIRLGPNGANFQIVQGRIDLAPTSSFTSTIAVGRTLNIGSHSGASAQLTGNSNATLLNQGRIFGVTGSIGTANEPLKITNQGTIAHAGFMLADVDNTGGVIRMNPSDLTHFLNIANSTIVGGELRSYQDRVYLRDGTTIRDSLMTDFGYSTDQFIVAGQVTFENITLNSPMQVVENTTTFSGTNQINRNVENGIYGSGIVMTDGSTLNGNASIINHKPITGQGTINLAVNNSNIYHIRQRDGRITATTGDFVYGSNARIIGGILDQSGGQGHRVDGGNAYFSGITLAADTAMQVTAGSAEIAGTTKIDGLLQNSKPNTQSAQPGFHLNNVQMTGTGSIANGSNGRILASGGVGLNHIENRGIIETGGALTIGSSTVDNVGGRLVSRWTPLTLNTVLTGGEIVADTNGQVRYAGGSITGADLYATLGQKHVVTGDTTFRDVHLRPAATMDINTGVVATFEGSLKVNGTVNVNGTMNLAENAVLSGGGVINGAMSILEGSLLAPGNSTGLLVTGSQTWLGGGAFEFEINDVSGTAGDAAGWDFLQINGILDIQATAADPFLIDVVSLTPAQTSGAVLNFDRTATYQWKFLTATGGIIGFDPSRFLITTVGFLNDFTGGQFGVLQDGNDLLLTYGEATLQPVPEPSTLLLGGMGLLGALGYVWRRRKAIC